MKNELLRLKDISIGYKGYILVSDINMCIQPGMRIGIIGESGVGKSTLGRVIAGYLQPIAGEVFYSDEVKNTNKIQILEQDYFHSFSPFFSIKSQLMDVIYAVNKYRTREENELFLNRLLSGVGIDPEIALSLPFGVSGGELQRASLARALIVEPKILIADEITSYLDNITKKSIAEYFLALQKQYHFALIFISHDREFIKKYSDSIYKIEGKRLYHIDCNMGS